MQQNVKLSIIFWFVLRKTPHQKAVIQTHTHTRTHTTSEHLLLVMVNQTERVWPLIFRINDNLQKVKIHTRMHKHTH